MKSNDAGRLYVGCIMIALSQFVSGLGGVLASEQKDDLLGTFPSISSNIMLLVFSQNATEKSNHWEIPVDVTLVNVGNQPIYVTNNFELSCRSYGYGAIARSLSPFTNLPVRIDALVDDIELRLLDGKGQDISFPCTLGVTLYLAKDPSKPNIESWRNAEFTFGISGMDVVMGSQQSRLRPGKLVKGTDLIHNDQDRRRVLGRRFDDRKLSKEE